MATSTIKRPLTSDWGTITSWMNEREKGAASAIWVDNVITVSLMTELRAHAEDDLIMTLPERWRPPTTVDVPAYYNGGSCVLRISPNGNIKIWIIKDTTTVTRIYAYFTVISYPH